MSLFLPDYLFHRIDEISMEFLSQHKIKGIILDVDNTLTTHNNPVPDEKISAWLDQVRQAGIPMMIVSNNYSERVKPFAEILKLDFVANGAKPLPMGILKACKRMHISPEHTAVIGDQIFTDMMGANAAGAVSVLVEPIELEPMTFFKVKRFLEKPLIQRFHKRRGNRE